MTYVLLAVSCLTLVVALMTLGAVSKLVPLLDTIYQALFGLYEGSQFQISTSKLILDELENINTVRLQHCIQEEDYRGAQYYKDLGETISRLKAIKIDSIEPKQ